MPSILNMTALDAALKEVYTTDYVLSLASKKQPALALLPKADVFYGDTYVQPIKYANPQGRSATHSAVEAAKAASALTKFVITTRAKEYAAVDISAEAMKASSKDMGAFFAARKFEIDGMIENVGRALGKWVVGDGSAALGYWSSTSTNTVTLVEAEDASNFEVGMVLQQIDVSSSYANLGNLTVSNVDEDAGTVTFSSAPSASLAAGDFFVGIGDGAGAAVTTTNAKVGMGLGAWLPSTVTSTAFWGVDRTTHATRLGGLRYTGTGLSKEEVIIRVCNKLAKAGASVDLVLMSYADYVDLEISLGNRVKYTNIAGEGMKMGFTGIEFATSAGMVNVVMDPNVKKGTAFVLDRSTWKIIHMGGLPHLVDDDGNTAQRLAWSNNDGIEVRCRAFYNLVCSAPGFNARITW